MLCCASEEREGGVGGAGTRLKHGGKKHNRELKRLS